MTPDHNCLHEVELGLMDKKIDRILAILDGNGKPGLKTQVELNKVWIGIFRWAGSVMLLLMLGSIAERFLK